MSIKDRLKDVKIAQKLRDLEASDAGFQEELVSGTNIKTVNGNSLLGSGDLVVGGGSSAYVSVTFDNGASAIEANSRCDVRIPYNMTITKVTVLANTTGSIVIDIWKDTYVNYPPTVADTITASAKPTISSANKYEDSTLTGWDTSVSSGNTLRVYVDSCSSITRCVMLIEGTKT